VPRVWDAVWVVTGPRWYAAPQGDPVPGFAGQVGARGVVTTRGHSRRGRFRTGPPDGKFGPDLCDNDVSGGFR